VGTFKLPVVVARALDARGPYAWGVSMLHLSALRLSALRLSALRLSALRRSASSLIALGFVSAGLTGCWTEVRPTAPEVELAGSGGPTGDGTALPAPTVAPTADVEPEVDAAELAPPLPSLRFAETEGTSEANVAQWFSLTPDRLSRCKGTKGTKMRVYVTALDGDVHASVDQSDASATTAGCVLETIAFELDNALAPSVSPSERANPVESMLILAW
jgi:hypothetical protein